METILKITTDLISLTKAVLQTRANVKMIFPIVLNYQTSILDEMNATDNDGNKVLTPKKAYTLNEKDFNFYLKRCHEEADKNNLKHNPDCCPLLTAESEERDARYNFCNYILPLLPQYNNIPYNKLLRLSKDNKKDDLGRYMFLADELVNITLSFIVPQINSELLLN